MSAPAETPASARSPLSAPAATAASPTGVRWINDWRIRFAILALIWGFSFLFIKVGTEAFAPLQVSLGRMVCGAAVLCVVLAVRRERLPREPRTLGRLWPRCC
jgi:drug/metabolite transporter (DMT)-like permease